MRNSIRLMILFVGLTAVACGGKSKGSTPPDNGADNGADEPKGDPAAEYGPLDVGSDYQSYTKVNAALVDCTDHGGRLCDTYVNDIGLEAYKTEDMPIPEGAIVVKTSFEKNEDGTAGAPGPIFVMKKEAKGFNPDQNDWYWAMHWESPSEKWAEKLGGPVYWRTPSKKVGYCWGCHENYHRELGMVPEDQRAW